MVIIQGNTDFLLSYTNKWYKLHFFTINNRKIKEVTDKLVSENAIEISPCAPNWAWGANMCHRLSNRTNRVLTLMQLLERFIPITRVLLKSYMNLCYTLWRKSGKRTEKLQRLCFLRKWGHNYLLYSMTMRYHEVIYVELSTLHWFVNDDISRMISIGRSEV